jgi:hypothetical protein
MCACMPSTARHGVSWLVFPLIARRVRRSGCLCPRVCVFWPMCRMLWRSCTSWTCCIATSPCATCLLDAQDRARLCDLGLAGRGAWRCDRLPIYDLAPELVVAQHDKPYTNASETWSFGVLMLDAMLVGIPFWYWHHPLAALEDAEQFLPVCASYRSMLAAPVQEWPLFTLDSKLPFEFDQAAPAASNISVWRRGIQAGTVVRHRTSGSDIFVVRCHAPRLHSVSVMRLLSSLNPYQVAARAAAVAGATSSSAPSPSAWVHISTDDGTLFFYNSDTGESSWERPAAICMDAPVSRQLAEGWAECSSDEGFALTIQART